MFSSSGRNPNVSRGSDRNESREQRFESGFSYHCDYISLSVKADCLRVIKLGGTAGLASRPFVGAGVFFVRRINAGYA